MSYFDLKASERLKGSRKGVELERVKQKLQKEDVAIHNLDAKPIEVLIANPIATVVGVSILT